MPRSSQLRSYLYAWTARLSWLPYLVRLTLAFGLGGLACSHAPADVGVVLNESLDEDVDRISSTGHSAVYFSRICPESPVKLRLCGSGEQGSIMSNYLKIGEDQPFEWNVVPLNVYLYGVEDPRNRPLFASYKIKRLLEDRYRQNYLAAYCTSAACVEGPTAEWREMVAATLIRGVYIFSITTTVEQDRQFIAAFNDSANRNHFNGVTRNCADFTKRVINTYFPHAAKTDYLNDFGMTSPKAVARTFTHYARRHPDSQLRAMHFAQVPGTIKRSRIVRSGTEQLFHSVKLAVPMTFLLHYSLPVFTASYFTTGRFNAEKEFERRPSSLSPLTGYPDPKAQIVGTPAEWKDLRKSLDSMVSQNGASMGHPAPAHFFKDLDDTGTPFLGNDGAAWLTISIDGRQTRLGVSASNIVAQDSDSDLSYRLLLSRTAYTLKVSPRGRETLPEFKQDWSNLQRSFARYRASESPVSLAKARLSTPRKSSTLSSRETDRGARPSGFGKQ